MTDTPLVGSTFFGLDISQLGEKLSSMRRRVSKRVLVLEFGTDLHLAEACLTQQGVQLNHISSVALPPEALDRGVPAEPAKMAKLIQQLCIEKKIPAHRVAVVLPPEVAFQRLLDLPGELTTEEARQYVLDPAQGVQLPFPLAQTDFDLVPMSTPSIAHRAPGMRLYMLSAVPQLLVDRVIEMLQAADLELQLLELGSLSQLRALALDLVMLAPHQVELVLELRPDCSNLMLVTCSGLLATERLAAIRDFPEPELDEEQTTAALEVGLSAEAFTVQDESYLPISDLDLRVLISDLKAALGRFNAMFPGAEIRCLQLTGINSAHPMLVDLLHEALGFKVFAHRPLLAPGVAGFAADEVLVQTGLGRLVGLALGLLNRDQLVTCPVDGLEEASSRPHRPGVAIEELLESGLESSSIDQAPVVADQSVSAAGEESAGEVAAVLPVAASIPDQSMMSIASPDAVDLIPLEPEEESITSPPDDEDEAVFAGMLDLLDEPDHWPSIGVEMEQVVDEEEQEGPDSADQDWPSIAAAVGKVAEEEKSDVLRAEVEEWPRIGGDVFPEPVEESTLVDRQVDKPWPSIGGVAEVGVDPEQQEGFDAADQDWPSIAAVIEDVVEEVEQSDGSGDEVGQWPSINTGSHAPIDSEVLKDVGSESWPTIAVLPSEDEEELSESQITSLSAPENQQDTVLQESDVDSADEDVLLVIPGLEVGSEAADDRLPANKDPVLEEQDEVELGSLGELRFAEPE